MLALRISEVKSLFWDKTFTNVKFCYNKISLLPNLARQSPKWSSQHQVSGPPWREILENRRYLQKKCRSSKRTEYSDSSCIFASLRKIVISFEKCNEITRNHRWAYQWRRLPSGTSASPPRHSGPCRGPRLGSPPLCLPGHRPLPSRSPRLSSPGAPGWSWNFISEIWCMISNF